MKKSTAVLMITVVTLAGCATFEDLFEKEQEIELSAVPAAALNAAKGAVKGIVLTEAEMEEEDGQVLYELEGTANGKTYEIEVTAEGKVLEVEEDE
ncbi:MAG: PepSY domain-containing protein [Kiritimatiellia bacterium]|jgi:uncharacterized membrane protein YkoI|nr:PepSY domain-containing protein [Kiritimatiellia bacterium]